MFKTVTRFINLFVSAYNLNFRFILLKKVEFSKPYRQVDIAFEIYKLK